MKLQALTGFDGSCPRSDKGVKRTGGGTLVFYPGWRARKGIDEEAPGGGSRFSARVRNPDKKTVRADILVDWESTERVHNHDYGYLRHETDADWTSMPGAVEGTCVRYSLPCRPGVTSLGLFPEFNWEACRKFVAQLRQKHAAVKSVGRSRGGRDIWRVSFRSGNRHAKNILILAREHPYETAGSYAVEGVATFLTSDDPMAAYVRSQFHVHILPMCNPDGVHDGMSRLTAERGVNLMFADGVDDPAHTAIRGTVEALRPFSAARVNLALQPRREFHACFGGRGLSEPRRVTRTKF